MNHSSTPASQTIAKVYGAAVLLYGLHLTILGVWLLLGRLPLGIPGLYYVVPGAVLCGLGIVLGRGHAWPAFPAFLVSLIPGFWPLLWRAAEYRSMVFLWSEILPLIAPAAFAVATLLLALLAVLRRSSIAPARLVTTVYAAALSAHSLFLICFGVWIHLHVRGHAPFEVLYLIPGGVLAVLSLFLFHGHVWPAVPALAASAVPGIWPLLWLSIAARKTPVPHSWEGILLLSAPAAFTVLTVILVVLRARPRRG